MSTPINTGSLPKLLQPGIHKLGGIYYNEYPKEWKEIYDFKTSKKNYEEDVMISGLGLAQVKGEGSSTSYDSIKQAYVAKYSHVNWSLGYIVTEEEQDDNLYMNLIDKRTKLLTFSINQSVEIVCADVLNDAFTAGVVGGDGESLIGNAHPTEGGNQSNLITLAADLNEKSLEDLLQLQIANARDSRNNLIALIPEKLIVSPKEYYTATRIMESTLRVDTANNDINALRTTGALPGGICQNHYLDSAKAWFVKTNSPQGMTFFERKALKFTADNDFNTDNMLVKATYRFIPKWTDWRTMYGSPGA